MVANVITLQTTIPELAVPGLTSTVRFILPLQKAIACLYEEVPSEMRWR